MSIVSETPYLAEKIIHSIKYLTHLTPTTPFKLFKSPSSSISKDLLNSKICLPFNRFTNPRDFLPYKPSISIWNENHLQYLKNLNEKQKYSFENVIIKNPYKSQRLIQQSLNNGIKNLVVDTFDQLWKIHQIEQDNKSKNNKGAEIKYIWYVSDLQYDLKQILILNSYNIKISGVIINQHIAKNINNVKNFIQQLLKITNKIKAPLLLNKKKQSKNIQIQISQQNWHTTLELYQKSQYFKKSQIRLTYQKINFKMTKNYFIAAKILGENRQKQFVFDQQVYNYIGLEQIKKGDIVQNCNKKWLIAEIGSFPEANMLMEHYQKGYIVE